MFDCDHDARATMIAALATVRALPYVSDLARRHQVDYWEVAGADGGDCEDQVLRMRADLWRGAGWPIERLLPTLCQIEDGTGHAVLTVVFDDAEVILDPRHPAPLGVPDLVRAGYRFCSRLAPPAAPGGAWSWHTIPATEIARR